MATLDRPKARAEAEGSLGNPVRLWLENRKRDRALFNLAIDSKLRGCDLVHLLMSIADNDVTLATMIVETPDYGPAEIFHSMRRAGMISANAEGHPTADLRELGQLEPDIGPKPARSRWAA
jgi:hypothetical protein